MIAKLFLCYTHCDKESTVDYAARNIAEWCIFVNQNLIGIKSTINGQAVHLCSSLNNPKYNDGQRIVVELHNNDTTGSNSEETVEQINEKNITVWCYDTPLLQEPYNLSLIQFKTGAKDISNLLEYAHVTVYHTNGNLDSISIKADEMKWNQI